MKEKLGIPYMGSKRKLASEILEKITQRHHNVTDFYDLFGGDGRHFMIPCMYRGKKGKKGSEEFTSSYKEMMVYAKFCPFTGKPLYEDSLSSVGQADA